MKYLAAYLLLVEGGSAAPTAAEIKATLASVGVEAEEARVAELLASLEGKTLAEVIAAGNQKLASVPTGGASAGAPAAGAAAASEEAAEEEEEEAKEESDDDMGFGLFD
jgi:large subunit ribosomal protein LP2